MKKLLVAAIAFAVLSTAAAVVYRLNMKGSTTSIASANLPAPTSFGYRPLDKPRALQEFQFVDGSERVLTLTDFRGKIVLLNVWATWCPPCREEMPTLDRLQAKLGGAEFEVLALSIDEEGVPAVKEFYQELGIDALRIYAGQSSMPPSALNVLGLPTTLLIDREGRELGRSVGPAAWDSPEVVVLIRQHLGTP